MAGLAERARHRQQLGHADAASDAQRPSRALDGRGLTERSHHAVQQISGLERDNRPRGEARRLDHQLNASFLHVAVDDGKGDSLGVPIRLDNHELAGRPFARDLRRFYPQGGYVRRQELFG